MNIRSINMAVVTSLFIVACSSSVTSSSTPSPNILPISEVIRQLEQAGYTKIHKIEYENGVYKAKVLNKQGNKITLGINPQTGSISTIPTNHASSTEIKQIIAAIEQAGYRNIHKLENKGSYYKAKAVDAKGNKVKVRVDKKTGFISTGHKD